MPGVPRLDVHRAASLAQAPLEALIDRFGFPVDIRRSSSLAPAAEVERKQEALEIENGYVAQQLVQTEIMRSRGAAVKVGWALSACTYDETYFDRLYRNRFGDQVTFAYTIGGRTLNVQRPRACPYLCREPERSPTARNPRERSPKALRRRDITCGPRVPSPDRQACASVPASHRERPRDSRELSSVRRRHLRRTGYCRKAGSPRIASRRPVDLRSLISRACASVSASAPRPLSPVRRNDSGPHAAFEEQRSRVIEDRLALLHRIEAALDDGAVDAAFGAIPVEELDDPLDRRLSIAQQVFVTNDPHIRVRRSSAPARDVVEPGSVLQAAFDEARWKSSSDPSKPKYAR